MNFDWSTVLFEEVVIGLVSRKGIVTKVIRAGAGFGKLRLCS